MTVIISDDNRNYEFHDVPVKVAKAVITILNECANDSSDVVPCITEKWIPIDKLESKEVKCPNCGMEIYDSYEWCPHCGSVSAFEKGEQE